MILKLQKGSGKLLKAGRLLLRLLFGRRSRLMSKKVDRFVDAVDEVDKAAGRAYKAADYPHGTKPPSKLPKVPPPPRKGSKPERDPNSSND